jgi:hypothetical protein
MVVPSTRRANKKPEVSEILHRCNNECPSRVTVFQKCWPKHAGSPMVMRRGEKLLAARRAARQRCGLRDLYLQMREHALHRLGIHLGLSLCDLPLLSRRIYGGCTKSMCRGPTRSPSTRRRCSSLISSAMLVRDSAPIRKKAHLAGMIATRAEAVCLTMIRPCGWCG